MKYTDVQKLMTTHEAERVVVMRHGLDGMILGTLKGLEGKRARVLLSIYDRERDARLFPLGQILGAYEGELKAAYDAKVATSRAAAARRKRIIEHLVRFSSTEVDPEELSESDKDSLVGRIYVSDKCDSASMDLASAERLIEYVLGLEAQLAQAREADEERRWR